MIIAINTYGPWRQIQAEPVLLDPPHNQPWHFATYQDGSRWWISNVETGMTVGSGYSKAAALDHANHQMSKYTPRALATTIRHRHNSGHVPPPAMLSEILAQLQPEDK